MSRGTQEGVRPHRDDLMGAKEAAELLGVPRSSLSRWLENGTIRPYGITGATPVFRRSDIETFKQKRLKDEQRRAEQRATAEA